MKWLKYPTPNLAKDKTTGEFRTRDSVSCIIIHYTAGNVSGAVNWLTHANSGVSAHLVIARDGDIYELAGPQFIAWHAGKSIWRGRQWCNNFSYGIELEAENELNLPDRRFTFTEQQYDSLQVVLWGGTVLFQGSQIEFDGIARRFGLTSDNAGSHDAEILGHEHVSPGRKFDPGPLFDWGRISQSVVEQSVVEQPVVEQPSKKPVEQPQIDAEKPTDCCLRGIFLLRTNLLKSLQRLGSLIRGSK